MKKNFYLFGFVLVLFAMLTGACAPATSPAAAPAAPVAGGKPVYASIKIEGTLEAVDGDQWTVNGQTFTVPAELLGGTAFVVGQKVKLEIETRDDGTTILTGVEDAQPSADDSTNDDSPSVDNGSTDASQEFIGTVEGISGDQWTIGGQTFTVPTGAELNQAAVVGSYVKVHVQVNPDGTTTVTEVELAEPGDMPGWDDNHTGEDENETEDESESEDESEDENETEDETETENESEDSGDDNSNDQDDSGKDAEDQPEKEEKNESSDDSNNG